MLSELLTSEAYEALDEVIQAEYELDGEEDGYVLQTDGKVLASLKKERRIRTNRDGLLKRLVPSIVDSESKSGVIDPKKWPALVDERADMLEVFDEEEEGLSIDDVRDFLSHRKDGDKGDDELRKLVAGRDLELRNLARDLKRSELKLTTAEESGAALFDRYRLLVEDREIDKMLDEVNVTDKMKRKTARLLVRDRKLEFVEGMDGEPDELLVDGVPISPWGKDWSDTEEGKTQVSAPDHSGGGDGGRVTRSRPAGEKKQAEFRKLDPEQRLTELWKDNAAS